MIVGTNSINDSVLAENSGGFDRGGGSDLMCFNRTSVRPFNLPFFQIGHFLEPVLPIDRSSGQVCYETESGGFSEYTFLCILAETKRSK